MQVLIAIVMLQMDSNRRRLLTQDKKKLTSEKKKRIIRKVSSDCVIDITHKQQRILSTMGDNMCTSANTENIAKHKDSDLNSCHSRSPLFNTHIFSSNPADISDEEALEDEESNFGLQHEHERVIGFADDKAKKSTFKHTDPIFAF